MNFLGILYGFQLVFILYLFTYFSVRGVLMGSAISIFFVLGKYLVYSFFLILGFRYLSAWAIITGLTGGIYMSLPILFFIHQRQLRKG